MSAINTSHSCTFKVGGDMEVNRLGFGAMRVTGPGVWDEPKDRTGALATLKRSPVVLPIPGTGKVKHLEENVAAASIALSDDDFHALDEAGRKAAKQAA